MCLSMTRQRAMEFLPRKCWMQRHRTEESRRFDLQLMVEDAIIKTDE